MFGESSKTGRLLRTASFVTYPCQSPRLSLQYIMPARALATPREGRHEARFLPPSFPVPAVALAGRCGGPVCWRRAGRCAGEQAPQQRAQS